MAKVNENRFCRAIGLDGLSRDAKRTLAGQKAALLKEAHWGPNPIITVSFMGGTPALQTRVKNVALGWTQVCGVSFHFLPPGPTNVRIAFKPGDGSWSYIGTVCQQIAPNQPTMNYGWLTAASTDDEVKRVVLHEFGHAIGLIHEHQNPKGGIKWNRPAVIKDLSGPPNKWDLAIIKSNIFDHYPTSKVMATRVDKSSIMMYPIPAAWTLDGFSTGLNGSLSATDKKLAKMAYPLT
jgi:Astacin (Peptidase family M12A).